MHHGSEGEDNEEELEIQLGPDIFSTRLTEIVREQYRKYLKNQLQENWKMCGTNAGRELNIKDADEIKDQLEECVALMEEKAIKACMMARIYQSTMTKIIAKIRRNTQEGRLEEHLQKQLAGGEREVAEKLDQNKINKATQTDCAVIQKDNKEMRQLPLAQRIEELRDFFIMQEVPVNPVPALKMPRQKHTRPKSTNTTPLSTSSTDVDNVTNIKSNTETMQKKATADVRVPIIHAEENEETDELERELAHMFRENDEDVVSTTDHATPSSVTEKTPSVANSSLHQSFEQSLVNSATNSHYPPPVKDLRLSTWPARLFFHRQKLAKYLNRLLEDDLRWREVMEFKFESLFGEDSDDEFTIYSPSIEIDNVVKCSSRTRIIAWVRKYLLQATNNSLPPDQVKNVAQGLAVHIIQLRQYPDEKYVQMSVQNYVKKYMPTKAVME